MRARTIVDRASPRSSRSLVFGALLAVALFAAVFPWFPGGERFALNTSARETVVASRAVTYLSEVLTAERREEAAGAVEDVWVFDPGVRTTQIATLDRRLERIEVARDDPTLADSARTSAIRAASDGGLSGRGARAFADASDVEWSGMQEQSRQVLSRILAGALDADDLLAARLRASGLLPAQLTADQTLALSELLGPLVVPTLAVDTTRTAALRAEAAASQPPVRVTLARGEIVVAEGEPLTAAVIERLDELGLRRSGVRLEEVAAAALFALLVSAMSAGYVRSAQPASLSSLRRLSLFALLLALPVLAAKFAFPTVLPDDERHFLTYALPFAATPIAAAVLLDTTVAIVLTLLLAVSMGFVATSLPVDGGTIGALELTRIALVVVVSSLGGLLVAAGADRLQRYLVAGAAAALASELALLAIWFLDPGRAAQDLLWMTGASMAGGLLAAMIAVGTFILLSRPFGIVTRVELMELSQLSHPLLRRLQDEAPGTFQHSVLVGNLAERAADRIGADPLLARVGAYYHDIGKLVSPAFFIENTPPEENPHEGLDPLQSTRVIHQHVTAGEELARREGLPGAIVQFIPQHHGTRMTSYFYRRAAEADPEIEPDLFRYPGPKPQSREAALVMLADAAEASVRAAADRSAERIGSIVEGLIRERIEEGQFSECDISLRDLATVGRSYATALTAVYHPRVEYPAPTERERSDRGMDRAPDRTPTEGGAAAPDVAGDVPGVGRRGAARAAARERGEDDS